MVSFLKQNLIKNQVIYFIFCLSFVFVQKTQAQLGFCTGNSGDPIFTEDFGSGTTAMALPAGTTSYLFNPNDPNDGFYTVSNRTNYFGWFDIPDHTPGDVNGRSLIINADFTPGEFFKTTVTGLCENTSYEFSSWMINLLPSSGCSGQGIPINVRFEIWDNSESQLLASGNTGDIAGTSSPNWEQYALVFQTLPGQSEVILKMRNNGPGGCGNDLALDDIMFKSCGDNTTVFDTTASTVVTICEDEAPITKQLVAIPDNSIFTTHFYQWQQSPDGVSWLDIPGATSDAYNASMVSTTTFFRVKVAEAAINLNNNLCNLFSDAYELRIETLPAAPQSNGDIAVCNNNPTPISVSTPNGVSVDWYDAPTAGNLLAQNTRSYTPSQPGTYYAESRTANAGCTSISRTAVNISYLEIPEFEDDEVSFCENTFITLGANVSNAQIVTSYLWSTGETTKNIQVASPGIYTVEAFSNNCSNTKTVTVTQIDNPVIDTIISDGSNIVINTLYPGDFLYSLNGNIFQSDNVFNTVEGGRYTIYLKHPDCAQLIARNYVHFYIPKFFTPNGDGVHDTFNLSGIEFYNSYQVAIYDRYGKLLKFSSQGPFSWSGIYNGNRLPSVDYWYVVFIEDQKFTGHFTLKR